MHIGSCACVQIVVALPDAEAQVFKFEMSDVESHYQALLPPLWAPRSTLRACVRACVCLGVFCMRACVRARACVFVCVLHARACHVGVVVYRTVPMPSHLLRSTAARCAMLYL